MKKIQTQQNKATGTKATEIKETEIKETKTELDSLSQIAEGAEVEKSIDLAQSELLNRAEVVVTVNIAELSMTVAEVLDLIPGQIVALPENLGEVVGLYIGDNLVGTAKLVKKDREGGKYSRKPYLIGLQISEVI